MGIHRLIGVATVALRALLEDRSKEAVEWRKGELRVAIPCYQCEAFTLITTSTVDRSTKMSNVAKPRTAVRSVVA